MPLSDYSELENEIQNAPQPKILPRGVEVRARIVSVNSGISDKNDAVWYMPIFDVPDDPTVIEFRDFFWDPLEKDKIDEKQYSRLLPKFKSFSQAFGIDLSKPFDWEDDLPGLEGWVVVGVKKDNEYGDQNTVSKYVTGR